MSKHLSSVMIAVLAVTAFITAPASADHRPGNVVVLGGTISQTGVRAVRAGLLFSGRKLYVDELNARGGLLGHRVELKIYDDKTDKRTTVELYEKLITEDKVDLVLGPYSSYLTDSVANVMERYRQPFVAHASKPEIYQRGRKYIFSMPVVFARNRLKGALHVARKIGVERIAFITLATATERRILVSAQEWADKLGLKVVLSERYPVEETEFRPLLQRIRGSGAEAIISIDSGVPAVIAQLRQLRELNINVKLFFSALAAAYPKFVEELGSAAEYVVGRASWLPKPALAHPGQKEFLEKYEKRYGVKPIYLGASGYAAMQVMEAAVKEAGSFDPEKVRDALASIAVYTVRGAYKANEKGMSPIDGLTFQIRNGERVIVWPNRFAEARVLTMPKWAERATK